eukprot:2834649-Amphidinium_carterae.1
MTTKRSVECVKCVYFTRTCKLVEKHAMNLICMVCSCATKPITSPSKDGHDLKGTESCTTLHKTRSLPSDPMLTIEPLLG